MGAYRQVPRWPVEISNGEICDEFPPDTQKRAPPFVGAIIVNGAMLGNRGERSGGPGSFSSLPSLGTRENPDPMQGRFDPSRCKVKPPARCLPVRGPEVRCQLGEASWGKTPNCQDAGNSGDSPDHWQAVPLRPPAARTVIRNGRREAGWPDLHGP